MRTRLILIITATAAAGIGAAAGVAQSGAFSGPGMHAAAQPAPRVVVVRGPRGLRGFRCARGPAGPPGPAGPQGPAGPPGTDHVSELNINWSGSGHASGHDTASVSIAGIGTLNAVCNASQQTLQLVPASGGVRTVANISDFEGSVASNTQPFSTDPGRPIIIGSPTQPGSALPPNGMMMVTFSVQPVTGDGGPGPAPATLTLSSDYKVNDPDPTQNSCYIAGQVIQGG